MSNGKEIARPNACVVVLGDIGRSPRMEYHATSLLEENFNVDIIGYMETKPLQTLSQCKIYKLPAVPFTSLTPKLNLIFKTIWQTLSLFIALLSIRRPHLLLVQNPPGIPTLFVCYAYCLITRTKFVIDWHNYTYTILALSMANGEQNRFCRIAKWIEQRFGAKAHANFCVTKAMQQDLQDNWQIRLTTVLYDRPPSQFRRIDLKEKHTLFMKLSKDYTHFMAKCYDDLKKSGIIEATAFTQKLSSGEVLHKSNREAILISSTSWTPDEDFGILLKALEIYEIEATKNPETYPNLLCVITGKGPQKEYYMKEIEKLNWQHVSIITPWLESEDYPTMLAAADLGVCLHWSSSGLDLPMKVVDMFGCGLPVCAYKFKCLDELVKHDVNGFVFEDYKELGNQLANWFEKFPNNPTVLVKQERFQRNLSEFQSLRWRENWQKNALPVLNRLVKREDIK